MTRDPKLRLVPPDESVPPAEQALDQPDRAEGSDPAERRDAAGVRALVHATTGRGELAPADHEALIALALGEDVAEISPREAAAAERLRLGLSRLLGDDAAPPQDAEEQEAAPTADGELAHVPDPLIEVAEAMRAARADSTIDDLTNERLIRQALRFRERVSRRWAWGALGAVAAGVALFIGSMWIVQGGTAPSTHQASGPPPPPAPTEPVKLIEVRSTQTLFDPTQKFPVRGGESTRMDRIAGARAADLRANRFAAWGVR